ncbi:MAG: type II toxin-antitoxin system VapC family toxin [Deltaproteobacteria bacterium]|nr:MAG: type II toxin-antitoxin system VapC family toxin [Deltaproteobacteria bacterium]
MPGDTPRGAGPGEVQSLWPYRSEGQRGIRPHAAPPLPKPLGRGLPEGDPSVAAVRVLVDTDILIDYFNAGAHGGLLDDPRSRIYYSVVTRKELLAKKGLSSAERGAIAEALRRFRLVRLGPAIAGRYWSLRRRYPDLEKEDALIAATALVKRLPLLTGNWKHCRHVAGLALYAGRQGAA